MSARTHSASSRGSSSNHVPGATSGSGSGARRYRRIAHSPQVDDTLFGEKHSVTSRKNDRTLQAGRYYIGKLS